MGMTVKQRKMFADFLRGRAEGCYQEAIVTLESAIVALRTSGGDIAGAEEAVGDALCHMGEARGFLNAAADVVEKEDLYVTSDE